MFSFGNEISLQVWNNHGSGPHVYILISVNDSMNNGLVALCDASRMLATREEEHEPSLFLNQYFRYRPSVLSFYSSQSGMLYFIVYVTLTGIKGPNILYCSCLLQASTQQPNNTSRWYYCSVVATITPLWCRMEVHWELSKAPDNVNFHRKERTQVGLFRLNDQRTVCRFPMLSFQMFHKWRAPYTVCRWEDWHHTFV